MHMLHCRHFVANGIFLYRQTRAPFLVIKSSPAHHRRSHDDPRNEEFFEAAQLDNRERQSRVQT